MLSGGFFDLGVNSRFSSEGHGNKASRADATVSLTGRWRCQRPRRGCLGDLNRVSAFRFRQWHLQMAIRYRGPFKKITTITAATACPAGPREYNRR